MRLERMTGATIVFLAVLGFVPNLLAQTPGPAPVPSAPFPPPAITCELESLYTDDVHIKLTWSDCTNEEVYVLMRTQDETRLPDPSVWIVVATIDADTTTYHDYTVQPYDPVSNPKGTYYYKVVAYNEGGETESNNCNETMPSVNVRTGSGNHSGYCAIDAAGTNGGGAISIATLLALAAWGLTRGLIRAMRRQSA